MSEPVFQFSVTLTKEDYKRFNRTVLWRMKRIRVMVILLLVMLVFYVAFLLFCYRRVSLIDFLPLVVMLCALLYYTVGMDAQAAKFFKINKMGGESQLLFYEDSVQFVSKSVNGTWRYEDLNSIIVTKTDIYLMNTPVFGLCIKKTACPDGFPAFIHNLRTRYHK